MRLLQLCVGRLQTNCYILSDDNGITTVIDPGDNASSIRAVLQHEHLTLGAILLTHGHFDHTGAVNDLLVATKALNPIEAVPEGVRVYCHRLEQPALISTNLSLAADFSDMYRPIHNASLVEDGDEIIVGDLTFGVLHTPGHTVGSVCYAIDGKLFAGDTLFRESIGRTDFPGGDLKAMRASLNRLLNLRRSTYVFPGHGKMTTIEHELAHNPYIR